MMIILLLLILWSSTEGIDWFTGSFLLFTSLSQVVTTTKRMYAWCQMCRRKVGRRRDQIWYKRWWWSSCIIIMRQCQFILCNFVVESQSEPEKHHHRVMMRSGMHERDAFRVKRGLISCLPGDHDTEMITTRESLMCSRAFPMKSYIIGRTRKEDTKSARHYHLHDYSITTDSLDSSFDLFVW